MQTVGLLDSLKKNNDVVLNEDISNVTPDPVLLLANVH